METRLRILLVGEVQQQCSFALMGANALVSALQAVDQDLVWFSVQSILASIANVSKVLWPIKDRNSNRGTILRQLLNVSDDSILKSRKFRDAFEHVDERIELWYNEHGRYKTSIDGGIGPSNGYTAQTGSFSFRHFDTILFAVTFRGELYALEPVLTAARLLHDEAEKVIEKLLQQDHEEYKFRQ